MRWPACSSDDGPVEDVERRKRGSWCHGLVVVRHGAEPAFFSGRPGWVRRMISLVPTPSALERMIAARQAFSARRSVPDDRFKSAADGPRDRDEILVRMRHTRTNRNSGTPNQDTSLTRSTVWR